MKILVQNLQKKAGLMTDLVNHWQPDIMLAQEVNWTSESKDVIQAHSAAYISSRMGYGTVIYAATIVGSLMTDNNIRRVPSPHAEIGGIICKKTIIATCHGIDFVSFHGYNGQPRKNVSKLVDHVKAVLAELDSSNNDATDDHRPVVWAGDWNTWSKQHLKAVEEALALSNFQLVFSWPYPGRDVPLDHVFYRGNVHFQSCTVLPRGASDHLGSMLVID